MVRGMKMSEIEVGGMKTKSEEIVKSENWRWEEE